MDTRRIARTKELQAIRAHLAGLQGRMKLIRLMPEQRTQPGATGDADHLDVMMAALSFASLRQDQAAEADTPLQLWQELANMDRALGRADQVISGLLERSGRGALLLGAELTARRERAGKGAPA